MSTSTIRPDGRVANWLGGAFYVVVAAIALAGQTGAAVAWLDWPILAALPAVAALELGGIALAARADFRRRLGENAYTARVLSAAVAIFAVVFNWLGHPDKLQGGFFAGMSALGYAVWLINAEDRRRDHLRKMGNLPPPAPVYGLWQWINHPALTRRARALARQYPRLGLYGSLDEARTQLRRERRRRAVARVLRKRLVATVGRDLAELAIATYDLDSIAERILAGSDPDGLARMVSADLTAAVRSQHHAAASVPTADGTTRVPARSAMDALLSAPTSGAGAAYVPAAKRDVRGRRFLASRSA